MDLASRITAEGAGGRACVLGLGRSGMAASRLLLHRGMKVCGLELSVSEEIRLAWEPLAEQGGELIAGPHPMRVLDDCTLLVRSPGVPAEVPILAEAKRRGIPVRSELALAAGEIRTPMLAITGTNGKSTTTAWTAHLLRRAGVDALAVGNIGRPLAAAFLDEPAETVFVVEVSSFQLEDSPEFHPRAAAILNITPDHLDRHGSFAAYTAAKWVIASHQEAGDMLVLGPGLQVPTDVKIRGRIIRCDPDLFSRQERKPEVQKTDSRSRETDDGGPCHGAAPSGDALYLRKGIIVRRSEESECCLLPATGLSLLGPHNVINAMAAVALASALVPERERLVRGLRDFPGLPHRLEEVGRIGDVRMINDSKSTNVDSLRVALSSFTEPVVLIAGGRDKEGPFEDLADLAARTVRHMVAIGEASEKIRRSWPEVSSETAADLDAAISLALAASAKRGIVLLSPGCASFDMFRDYEERGAVFRALVTERSDSASRGDQGR